jgi:hypothetical protein
LWFAARPQRDSFNPQTKQISRKLIRILRVRAQAVQKAFLARDQMALPDFACLACFVRLAAVADAAAKQHVVPIEPFAAVA